MMTENRRIYLFDNMKFILMLLVVFGHCMEPYATKSGLFKSTYVFIYFFHMPAFIFIAGLFAGKTIADRQKVLLRIRYLLIMFLLLKIFICLLDVLINHVFAFDLLTTEGVAWFLLVLAYFYGITWLVRRYDGRLVLAVSIGLACLAGYSDWIGDFLCLSRTIVYYPFFYLGYIINARRVITWKEQKGKPAMMAGFGVIASFAYLCFFHIDLVMKFKRLFSGRNPFSALAYPQTGGLQRLVYYPAIVIFIFSLIALMPDRNMRITELGKRTMQVYFFHFSLIYIVRAAGVYDYVFLNLSGVMRLLVFFLIALGITLFFSHPVWGLLFKPFRRGPSPS